MEPMYTVGFADPTVHSRHPRGFPIASLSFSSDCEWRVKDAHTVEFEEDTMRCIWLLTDKAAEPKAKLVPEIMRFL